jgi:hypothetical protein
MTTSSVAKAVRVPGRLFLALGLLVPALGVVGFIVQMSMQRLVAPWYMPAAATLGVVLVAVSLWQGRSVWRVLALVLVVLLAGAEWAMMAAMRTPAYTGPVAAGQTFPKFTTLRTDGTPFTRHDLEGGPDNVLVFFRGRW